MDGGLRCKEEGVGGMGADEKTGGGLVKGNLQHKDWLCSVRTGGLLEFGHDSWLQLKFKPIRRRMDNFCSLRSHRPSLFLCFNSLVAS